MIVNLNRAAIHRSEKLDGTDFDGTAMHRVTQLDEPGCQCNAGHMGGDCVCEQPKQCVNWDRVCCGVAVICFWALAMFLWGYFS